MPILPNQIARAWQIAVATMLLSACQTPSAIDDSTVALDVPENFVAVPKTAIAQLEQQNLLTLNRWLANVDNQALGEIISKAIADNRQLKITRLQLQQAEQGLIISGATDWPELSLNVNQARRKNVQGEQQNYTSSAELSVDLSYELDVWGKLSAQQQQSQLQFKIAKANYAQALANLTADIVSKWYTLAEAQQLLSLYSERAENLQANLEQIKASYRLGLNQALDVYLTQNDVSSELARLAQQQQAVNEASRALQLVLGDYPSASLRSDAQLPDLTADSYVGMPSDLVTRRYDLNASWFALLEKDAALAVAHKNRFPRFAISASGGTSASALDELLDGSSLAWSLIGNISQPIFNAGRLEALEQQAFNDVKIAEQRYLDNVYQAFSEIENGIERQSTLTERLQHFTDASENASAAEKLAFDQYLKGIVSYTTVLESQRRAFDAQTALIQLKAQLLQNQLALALSVGGFQADNYDNSRSFPSSLARSTQQSSQPSY
ncbi:efflux transporter outer membrane subunit [Thalassotalea maritima]|uniref:efflux transporter outer membrane subunit n=1 Tax=Thalassotalea maritima TaxID=3242416 RepID=UPI003528B3C8